MNQMKRELILTSVLMIIGINLTAQEHVSGLKDNVIKTRINTQAMERDLTGMPCNNRSMSITAREAPSGPGKGTIVSNQAKQLGNAKRNNINSKNTALNHNESQQRNRIQMHASPFRRNPDLIAINAPRGAHRGSFHGRK